MISILVNGKWELLNLQMPLPEEFNPAIGGPYPDPKRLWQLVPSDLRALPSRDREIVEKMWSAAMQTLEDVLSETIYTNQELFLTETPLVRHKRWEKFVFRTHYNKLSDFAELLVRPYADSLAVSYKEFPPLLLAEFSSTDSLARLVLPASTPCSCAANLGGKVSMKVSGRGPISFGFFTPGDSGSIHSGLLLNARKNMNDVWEFRILLQHPQGATPADPAYRQFTLIGQAATWDGDFRFEWRPDVKEAFYDIAGLSGSFPVPKTFSVEEIGFTAHNLDPANYSLNNYLIQNLVPPGDWGDTQVEISELIITDTSTPSDLKYVPMLQTGSSEDATRLIESQDYEFVGASRDKSFKFSQGVAIPDYAWAESVGERSFSLSENFSKALDLPFSALRSDNTPFLRNLLLGLYYGRFHGPHTPVLHVAIAAISGIPIVVNRGLVISDHDRQGYAAVVVREESGRERVYYLPDYASPSVSVGDIVEARDLLSDVLQVLTWHDGEDFLSLVGGSLNSEAEKYQYLVVQLPVQAITSFENVERLTEFTRAYLKDTLPLWVSTTTTMIVYVLVIDDDMILSDSLDIIGTDSLLFDTMAHDPSPPIYNPYVASGDENRYGDGSEEYGELYQNESPYGVGNPEKISYGDSLELVGAQDFPYITSPQTGDVINDLTPLIEGEGLDGVEIGVNGHVFTVPTGGHWSWMPPSPLSPGDHTFTVTDGAYSESVTVTLQ